MSQLGRISGQLLKDNLTRNGHDLTFDDDLLHLDVTGRKVGIKNTNPQQELDVNGTTRTTDLEVTNQTDLGDITVLGNTITSNTGVLNLTNGAGDHIAYQAKLVVDNIDIENNVISTNSLNTNLEIRPNGSGTVDVYANTNVYGNIYATGDIRADGNITVGDANTDNITINADIASNIIPDQTGVYTLGDSTHRWADLWVNTIYADSVDTGDLVVDNINLNLRQGKIYYVSVNGTDTNSGTHQNDPFRSVSKATTVATAGDTIYVYPGVYEEIFPIEVPNGVTVKGTSLRSVTMKPTAATMYFDAFHMNGEATVEDFTITGFYHDPLGSVPEFPINNQGTGHAFRFSWGSSVTTRSPYIRNVTVITFGSPSVLAIAGQETQTIDGLNRIKSIIDEIVTNGSITKTPANPENPVTGIASDAGTGALLQDLIDDVIHIINNGTLQADLPTITANGTAVTSGMLYNAAVLLEANRDFIKEEITAYVTALHPTPGFVYDIATCQRDMGYILDAMIYDIVRGGNEHTVYAGLAHWVQPTNDPRGYARGDAGHGALIDGGAVDASSKEAAMLFHSVTFLTPAADTLIATNGARVEWLNSFTYFAGKGMYLYSSPEGFAQNGKTRIKITDTTGTWSVGDTLSYYDTDGTTVLASGVIESIDGDFYVIDGRVLGFETLADRSGKTVSVGGNAQLDTAVKRFGTASLLLDGTGDYVSIASQPDFEFGTGDFCIEVQVYPTTTGTYRTLFDLRSSAGDLGGIILGITDANQLYFYYNGNYRVGPVGTVPVGSWSHIALARVSGVTRAFVNGTQVGGNYTDTNNYAERPLRIGADPNGNYALTGHIDEVRISKGTGRYTTTFTTPTSAFLGDANTVLLLHFNGLDASTAVADDGITFQDLRTSSGGTASVIDVADYSDFGAEVRSIGSASVYGDYGVYGDGVGVIAYLIGQNLAYIGNGKETTNDPNTVIQANEIVELNDAKIYYQSVDHKGDFRIGDLFYVNQATGEVSFANSDVTIGTSLTFDDGLGNVTFLDATKIETGDFRISGNTVETLTQDFNVSAASNLINLESNVNITGNLDVTGDVTVGGNVTIGNQSTDTVQFVAGVDSDILPALDSTYDLGTPTERWNILYSSQVDAGSVRLATNIVSTSTTNTDLKLQANGTGRIYVPSNNVEIDQNLTVNGTTYLKDTNVTGTLTHVGDVTQTGNVTQTGDITLTGTLTTTGYAQFADIKIDTNIISTTLGNNDLTLDAAGTGKIYVPNNDVQIDQNLTVNGYIDVNSIDVNTSISSLTYTAGDIKLESNYITTLTGNNDLELRAAGTGRIYVPQDNVKIDNNLTVLGTTNLATTNIGVVGTPSTVTHVGVVTQTGDLFQTGNTEITGTLTVGSTAQFEDIQIDNNIITTTIGNNNLVLEAAGTGKVIVPSDNAEVTGTLTVVGTTSTTTINNTGTVTSGTFSTGTLRITSNNITTIVGNTDLVLEASGTGRIYIPSNDVTLGKGLTVLGSTTLAGTSVTGTLTHVGNTTRTGDVTQTGSYVLNGNLTVSDVVQFKDINITDNVITTTLGNNNLQLGAAGTGVVYVPSNDVNITNNLTVVGTTSTADIENTGTVTADTFSTGDISITDNTIQTTLTNSNLQLQAAGTGYIVLEQFDVQENELRINSGSDMTIAPNGTGIVNINSTQSIKLPVGATGDRPLVPTVGMIRYNSSLNRYEGYDGANWIRLDGVSDADGNTYITAELTPGANDNTIRFVTDGTQVADLTSSRLNVINVDVDDININNNTISTTTTNTNLVLSPNGTGSVRVGNFAFNANIITNTVNNNITYFNQTGDGYVKINSTGGFVIPTGLTEQRPALFEVGMMRYNTTDQRVEIWDGALWVGAGQGAGGGVTSAEAQDIGIVSAIIFG